MRAQWAISLLIVGLVGCGSAVLTVPIGGSMDASVGGGGGAAGSGGKSGAGGSKMPPPDAALDLPKPLPDSGTGLPDAIPPVDVGVDTPPSCPGNCANLPNIRPGVTVPCFNGNCAISSAYCLDGFAHCTINPLDGCETDLSRPQSCGSCYVSCSSPTQTCVGQAGTHYCAQNCVAPYPTLCGYSCVDTQTDQYNCGSCNTSCFLPNASSACVKGVCTVLGCSDPGFADCTADPGCETQLGTADNCAACGDKACAIANTLASCSSATSCSTAVCAPGFANCDTTGPSCETAFASGGACLPAYLGTAPLATQVLNAPALAIGSDGSYFIGGGFSGTVDFDPTAGQDIRTAEADGDAFITKFNANGSYAWTQTFGGRGSAGIVGLAAAANGAVVGVGNYSDTIDLDPGAGVDLVQTATSFQQDPLVVKLAANGSLVWGGTFASTTDSTSNVATTVAVDASDTVYVAGWYWGTTDFDPGPTTSVFTALNQSGWVVKLSSAGAFGWAQFVDDGGCSDTLNAITAATDGAVWAGGVLNTGPGCTLGPQPPAQDSSSAAFVVSYTAAGAARGLWTLGGHFGDSAAAIAAGPSGSVYVGGGSMGIVDFDPGPGVASRWMGAGTSGYILKLGSDASFAWVQTVDQVPITALASTADGGILGAGLATGAFVARLNTDGTAVWTFLAGTPQTSALAVAARGASFAVAGTSSGSGDFDPGATSDIVFGDIIYLSRYSF